MILRREQRPEPTGGEPTLRAAQAGRDRDWRRLIRGQRGTSCISELISGRMREPDAPEQRASPRGETFPLHQAPAKRRPGSERYGERANLHGASGDAQGELCSPPLHSRQGKSTDEAKRGAHKRARCGASGDTG